MIVRQCPFDFLDDMSLTGLTVYIIIRPRCLACHILHLIARPARISFVIEAIHA